MGLQHVDIGAALRRLAEQRIEDAMKDGKFDNLPGAGRPLDLEPMPAEENARMNWWALRILRQNDVTPDEVKWRKAIDHLRARLDGLTDESQVAPIVAQVNELVRRINTLGTNALKAAVVALDVDAETQRVRDRLAGR